MVKIEGSMEIKRPVAEVFGYMVDPKNLPEWNSLVEEASASETPLRVGSTITSRVRVLGRKIESVNQLTEYVVNQKLTQKADKPFPVTITNAFAAADGGTRTTITIEAEPGGFFKIGEPILVRILKKQLQAQLETLKELLEARTPAEVR